MIKKLIIGLVVLVVLIIVIALFLMRDEDPGLVVDETPLYDNAFEITLPSETEEYLRSFAPDIIATNYATEDSVGMVKEWYENMLPLMGWEKMVEIGELRIAESLMWRKNDNVLIVYIEPFTEEGAEKVDGLEPGMTGIMYNELSWDKLLEVFEDNI